MTDKTSFEKTKFWVDELLQLEKGCKIYLTGTKVDLVETEEKPKEIDFHDAADYAGGEMWFWQAMCLYICIFFTKKY